MQNIEGMQQQSESKEETDEQEEDDEYDSEEEEEEPKLKYQRLVGTLSETLKQDAVSSMSVSDRFLVPYPHIGCSLQQGISLMNSCCYFIQRTGGGNALGSCSDYGFARNGSEEVHVSFSNCQPSVH